MHWPLSVTVASVIFRNDRYLMVKEFGEEKDVPVLNQPAGHLEPGETLIEAAIRESFEETTWKTSIEGLLGIALFSTTSGKSYLRHTFLATPLEQDKTAELDSDIISTHWLDSEEIQNQSRHLRTPIVLESIKWHKSGVLYPLEILK